MVQKGPEIRTGVMRNKTDVSIRLFLHLASHLIPCSQIPIKAGHEFVLSTDASYKDSCDDKVMYVDYVRVLNLWFASFHHLKWNV